MNLSRPDVSSYHPQYLLAALGAGGLAVSFFMYLMFLVPHPDTPMVTFEHLWPLLTGERTALALLIVLDLLVIVALAVLHLRLLAWNLGLWRAWRPSAQGQAFAQGPGALALMALPLTLAMTINVLFVLGALFVPGLWGVVEWLFPGALAGFTAVGVLALRQLFDHLGRRLAQGGLGDEQHNSLAPLLAVFALSMVAVGLAAPAGMSQVLPTQLIAFLLSAFFAVVAVLLGVLLLAQGWRTMLAQGVPVAASPSLWIVIPIGTLLGITWLRLSHGMDRTLQAHGAATADLFFTAAVLSLQLFFGLLGWGVMRRLGYFRDIAHTPQGQPGAFALICPGVALFVFGFFFIHYGLVKTGLLLPLSAAHLLLIAPLALLQLKTLQVFLCLLGGLRRDRGAPSTATSVAA